MDWLSLERKEDLASFACPSNTFTRGKLPLMGVLKPGVGPGGGLEGTSGEGGGGGTYAIFSIIKIFFKKEIQYHKNKIKVTRISPISTWCQEEAQSVLETEHVETQRALEKGDPVELY